LEPFDGDNLIIDNVAIEWTWKQAIFDAGREAKIAITAKFGVFFSFLARGNEK
jgi:hypothetical protein